jgi:two-component system CheB/CheR fusion protein
VKRATKQRRSAPLKRVSKSIASEEKPVSKSRFFVAGLGASAGGLEALSTFFDAMPPDSGMAFVVIQHLSPNHKSMMAELLARNTRMPVRQAEDGVTALANHVYLIPPKKCLTIYNGKLLVTEWDARQGPNLPIDTFFCSLAKDCSERAIAIALSGTGADGTRGIREIKEAGGLVMIQDEQSARFSGMPHSAIATGLADYILPAGEMPAALLKFIRHPLHQQPTRFPPQKAASSMQKIQEIIRAQTGIDFSGYTRSTVMRRLERRMGLSQVENIDQYLEYLRQSPEEVAAFSKDLLISVTRFFRDSDAFKRLRQDIVPAIFAKAAKERIIRAWVPGCATGEEAYSLAILLQEHAATLKERYEVKIFATDVNKETVDFAGGGVYPASIIADVPAELLARYFSNVGNGYRLRRSIREQVVFARHNLMKDPPFIRMDLVSCRNLLIYLEMPWQQKVLAFLHFALRPGGYLFLGSSETLGEQQNAFDPVNAKARIFQKRMDVKLNLASHPIGSAPVFAPRREAVPANLAIDPNRGERRQEKLQEAIKAKLISDFAPTCFAVDERDEILYSFGQPEAFIALGAGQANLNLLKLAPRDLALALSTALRQARKKKTVVRYRGVKFRHNGASRLIDLKVEPMPAGRGETEVWLIFLEAPHKVAKAREGEKFHSASRSLQRIADLEEDLQVGRDHLQIAIEQQETSSEELQSNNEELIASNEELQSSNEELESVNEELVTLNAEYQGKNDELQVAHNDLDNFLRTSQIGTIFLDESLRIRKFTPFVAAELSLLPHDAGRLLTELSHPLIGELGREAQRVLGEGMPVEKTVEVRPGVWFLLRISPYRREGASDLGAVVTFVDVSRLKEAEQNLKKPKELVRR